MATTAWRDALEPVAEVLRDESDLVLAYAFGSVAKGKASSASDLDVGVLATAPLSGAEQRRLIGRLAQATGRPIDLVDLREAGMPLLQVILTTGRELFCRDDRVKAALLTWMLGQVEDFLPLRRRVLRERRELWID